jgi:hypothetical protein
VQDGQRWRKKDGHQALLFFFSVLSGGVTKNFDKEKQNY